jgi:molybdate-binding protein
VPNTAVALQLAGALGCRVEDLFVPGEGQHIRTAVHLAGPVSSTDTRIAAGVVGRRLVGYPLTGPHAVQETLAETDGFVRDGGEAELVRPAAVLDHTAVLLGCDPSLGLLRDRLARTPGSPRLLWLQAPSTAALAAVRAGEAHIAGTHLPAPEGGDPPPPVLEPIGASGGILVAFAAWEQGLAVASDNPLGIRGVADLARPGVRLVNREPGSGSRVFLDRALEAAGVPPGAVAGYDRVVAGHFAAARAIAAGLADAGVCLRAVANALGLGFVALDAVRFDLVIPRQHLEHPVVSRALELLSGSDLRQALAALPGYDVADTGRIIADVPASAA